MKKVIFCFTMALLVAACGQPGSQKEEHKVSLKDARKGFTTKIIKQAGAKGPVEEPPKNLFRIVNYPTPIGSMSAYLSEMPDDGKLRPAMIWISGGWGNDISDVWTPQDPDNDQSAAVLGTTGVIMMYPSQRGGNNNPGTDESCYGEIDDIVAAAKFLAQQPGIDPRRIYLGGHSTGATKAILTAEYSDLFRATFGFGPVAAIADYGTDALNFDTQNEQEFKLRSPGLWLHSLSTPLFVFEGVEGNYDDLKALESAAQEATQLAHFYALQHKNHFSTLQPVCKIIASKIMADSGSQCNISFSKTELQAQ